MHVYARESPGVNGNWLTMKHNIKIRSLLDDSIESIRLCDIRDDGNMQLAIGISTGICLADLACLVLRSNRRCDFISSLDQKVEDVR